MAEASDFSTQIVYLNGSYMPLSEARIPVLDRGFIFGDGIYEVVPVYEGRPFRLAHHLKRLKRSLAKIRITNPMDDAGWTQLIDELVRRHPQWPNQVVYMHITRGVAKRDHTFPAKAIRKAISEKRKSRPLINCLFTRLLSPITRKESLTSHVPSLKI